MLIFIRKRIKELFPADSEDGTTIMNGTIFVNAFRKKWTCSWVCFFICKIIKKYNDFWDLTNVEKSFKTKLYGNILKRDSWVKWMGQFFTKEKLFEI